MNDNGTNDAFCFFKNHSSLFLASSLYIHWTSNKGPLWLCCISCGMKEAGRSSLHPVKTADWRNDYYQACFSSISAALGGPLPHTARLTLKLHRIQFKPSFSLGSHWHFEPFRALFTSLNNVWWIWYEKKQKSIDEYMRIQCAKKECTNHSGK